ncbi:MAG TPA: LacI family DNA-binding transcriptional regulator [Actinomycetales bacterium]
MSRTQSSAPTLESVAERAGVSRATAGRVLAGSPRVSEQARAAVLAAADELSYVTNQAARSLVTRRSDSVAFVVVEPEERFFGDPFFALVLRGVHSALAKGRTQVLFVILADQQDRDRFERFARGGHLDGAIFVSLHGPDPLPERLHRSGLPVVLSGRPYEVASTLPFVSTDNTGGAQLATDALVARGCRRIVNIAGPADMTPGLDRAEGYRRAIARAGGRVRQRDIVHGDFSLESGRAAMERLLGQVPDLDGVFAANDLMALGALQALAAAGRVVPDDVAVVGFDDIPLAASARPALTTVRQQMSVLGSEMASLLLRTIGTQEAVGSVVVPAVLVRRDSA